MADKTKAILLCALCLGLLGDALFKDAGAGVNVSLFGIALAIAGWLFARSMFWLPFAAFAIMFAFRDATELRIANGTGMVLSAGAAMVTAEQIALWRATVFDYTWRMLAALCLVPAAFAVSLYKVVGLDLEKKVEFKRFEGPLRGLVFSAPLVVIFGLLFVSADARFEGWVQSITSVDMESIVTHGCIILAWAAVAGGILLSIAAPPSRSDVHAYPFTIGISEAVTILTVVNLLFIAFVVSQLGYFFGALPEGFTSAEYARRGFFELVWVAGIVLTLIPLLRGVVGEKRFDPRIVVGICVLVGCVLVIIASAFWRMNLYVNAYGLTMLRLYTSAFMIWLLLTFVWLVAVLLRKAENRFAFGALAMGFACIMGLTVANPDALIAKTNLALPGARDVDTLASLSADAIPVIAPKLGEFSLEGQVQLATAWKERLSGSDWRAMNASKAVARTRVKQKLTHP